MEKKEDSGLEDMGLWFARVGQSASGTGGLLGSEKVEV